MFTANANIKMAAREMTSADVKFSEDRAKLRTGFAAALTWLASIDAPDKYTVVWNCASYYSLWAWRFNGTALGQIVTPEMEATDPATQQPLSNDWHNQTGTGPYILTDFVSGAGATYTKNPNYWGSTTINGVSYQMPFIQTVRYPIIPDESTQIAAIRTGKIDWDPKVLTRYSATLKQTSPDLIQSTYLLGNCDYLKINRENTASALSNKNLRRALMIATDFQTIKTVIYQGGEWYSWPLAPGVMGYTPFDQLPAQDKELWTYSVSDAKQTMAAAGYPNGFSMQIMVSSANSQQLDLANALVSMWAKAGITATINVVDATSAATAFDQVTYKDCLMQQFTVVKPETTMNIARAIGAGSIYGNNDPVGVTHEAMYTAMSTEPDPVKRAANIQKLSLSLMDDVGTIGFTNPYVINAYWPWFKNYYGELDASYYNAMPMIMRGWIDQKMKTSLGK
jgi:peptide/nickel transport system substrate-binding protein